MQGRNFSPAPEHLEHRQVLSHVVPVLGGAHQLPRHAPVHHAAALITVHPVVAHRAVIAHRAALHHAARVHPAQATGFGGGNVDLTIPFVLGSDVSAPQFAVNFTSNTFQGVLFGFEWDGIQQISSRFGATGDANELASDLTALAARIPFGVQQLLPTWQTDLQSLQNGTMTPTPSGFSWGIGTSTGTAVADVLYADLSAYLAAGIGTSFNVLRSQVDWASDTLLTYNGFVGSNSLT